MYMFCTPSRILHGYNHSWSDDKELRILGGTAGIVVVNPGAARFRQLVLASFKIEKQGEYIYELRSTVNPWKGTRALFCIIIQMGHHSPDPF